MVESIVKTRTVSKFSEFVCMYCTDVHITYTQTHTDFECIKKYNKILKNLPRPPCCGIFHNHNFCDFSKFTKIIS